MISALTKKFTIAALITSCFFVFACENKMGDVQKWGRKHPQVDEARNIESFLSLEGKMKARLTAPVMLRYLDTLTEFPKSLHVDFYNDSLKVESQLSAKYGRCYVGCCWRFGIPAQKNSPASLLFYPGLPGLDL